MKKFISAIILYLLAMQISAKGYYTIIVSLDGCRWDYPEMYDTPFLDYMADNGVKSGLIPSYPSKTFPNHYTLATGLYPDHHGIIANSFVNRKTGELFSLSNPKTKYNSIYYKGEPIWITARKQGKKAYVYHWPGSDVKIKGMYPDVYFNYDEQHLSVEERITKASDAINSPNAPELTMLYFEQPDKNGHLYGPQAKQTRTAVIEMDSILRQLWNNIQQGIHKDSVNLIVVADHGMTFIKPSRKIECRKYLKPEWYERIEGYLPAQIYCKKGYADSVYNALKNIPHQRVWCKREIPAYLNYGTNANIGDIIVDPNLGYIVYDGKVTDGGMHGYDFSYGDMQAVFRAMGPSFRQGIQCDFFKNVDIYPLLCRLLGIKPAANDGKLSEVENMLK